MDFLGHERLFRTEEIMEERSQTSILVLGIGALGSNLIPLLVRNGFKIITGLDYDRVDRHNPANQYFTLVDVGRKKTAILKNKIRRELGVSITVIDRKVQTISPNQFKYYDLIIDTFDNWEARLYVQNECRKLKVDQNLLHIGMSDQGYSEIKWDDYYKIPEVEAEQEDICEYPLACNLVYNTVSLASEVICQYIDSDIRNNCTFTVNDISITKL